MGTIPSGVTIMWPGTNGAIPSGWTRVTSLDDKFVKGTADGVNPPVNGGGTHTHSSSSHTHALSSHTHSVSLSAHNVSAGVASAAGAGQHQSHNPHTHSGSSNAATPTSGSGSPSWSSVSGNPAYYTVIYVESNGSDPSGFPDGCIIYYNNASAPSDWGQHAASVGKFFIGASSGGNGGSTGGGSHVHSGSSHNHSTSAHAHSGYIGTHPYSYAGTGPMQTDTAHNHYVSLSSSGGGTSGSTTGGDAASASTEPVFIKSNAIENTSGEDNWLENGIALWLGNLSAIPDDWLLCDGSNSTPDLRGKFIKNNASGGGDHAGTGGDTSHTHTAPSTHTHSGNSHGHPSGTSNPSPYPKTYGWPGNTQSITQHPHNHPFSVSSSSSSLNGTAQSISSASDEPAFRTVAYIQAPEEPEAGGNVAMFGSNF